MLWTTCDYLFVDMPPGTGDVALNVFQSLPLDGIIIVASPQELVTMVVEKAVKMAEMMDIPIVGLVENMSYLQLPRLRQEALSVRRGQDRGGRRSGYGVPLLAKMPIDPALAKLVDDGAIENFQGDWLNPAVEAILK